jgi:small subunit ribosomal protein S20
LQEVKEVPNIKSAEKRVRIIKKKTLRNRMVKSSTRTAVKKFNKFLVSDVAAAQNQLSATTSAIDKAVAKGVIHKNAANRKKSRLARALHKATV